MNNKEKEIIMLLLEVNTVDALKEMLQEECWSDDVKECFREELKRRSAEGAM